MKIGLRGGHSKNALGAVKLRNEWACMQELYKYTRDVLVKYGHTVIDCNSNGNSDSAELYEGVSKANAANVDLFISLHMNAFNGSAHGTEAWTYGSSSRANEIAKRLVKNFTDLGFYNRGVKYNPNYYEMQHVNAPNIIFETLFCDSEIDINIWKPTPYEKMAYLIANAIDPSIPTSEETLEYDYYAVEEVDIVDSKGNITGCLWKDEKCKLKYVGDGYRKYVLYWNADKTRIKEGWVKDSSKVIKIGTTPIETQAEKTYKVQVGSYTKKENADSLVKELKEKGYDAYIKTE